MTDKPQTPTLKPCPFCGGEASLSQAASDPAYGHDVCCTLCLGGLHSMSESPTDAADLWNTRAQPTPEPREPTDAELQEVKLALRSEVFPSEAAAAVWHIIARQLRGGQ